MIFFYLLEKKIILLLFLSTTLRLYDFTIKTKMLQQILRNDRLTLNVIQDFHSEMLKLQVFSELRENTRDYRDRYIVEVRDNFFGGEAVQTIIINSFGGEIITEPISLNRRNRRQTLHRLYI